MTLRKKILLGLLVLPLLLLLLVLIRPIGEGDQHNALELVFLVAGLPIILLNFIEWSEPQFLDGIFGASRPASGLSVPSTLMERLPPALRSWKLLAALAGVLAAGILMGAGALFIFNRLNPPAAPAITPTLVSQVENTSTPSGPTPTASATEVVAPTVGLTPTSAPTSAPTPSPVLTPSSNRCIPATDRQVASVLAGIKMIQADNLLERVQVVQSSAADNLWFLAGWVKGASIPGGRSSEPAVWSFYDKDGTPFNIFAINATAGQYSDFNFGIQASPPLDMHINGANEAYNCARNSD